MDFAGVTLTSSYFWGIIAAIGLGGAAAAATVIPRFARNPGRARRGKPTRIFLSLTLTVLAVVGAAFFVPRERILPADFGISFAVASLASAICIRFPRAVGFPAVAFTLISLSIVGFALDSGSNVRGETVAARLAVVGAGASGLAVEVSPPEGRRQPLDFKPYIVESMTGRFRLTAEFVVLDERYALIGRRTVVSKVAVAADSVGFPTWLGSLPGIRLETAEAEVGGLGLFDKVDVWASETARLVVRKSP